MGEMTQKMKHNGRYDARDPLKTADKCHMGHELTAETRIRVGRGMGVKHNCKTCVDEVGHPVWKKDLQERVRQRAPRILKRMDRKEVIAEEVRGRMLWEMHRRTHTQKMIQELGADEIKLYYEMATRAQKDELEMGDEAPVKVETHFED